MSSGFSRLRSSKSCRARSARFSSRVESVRFAIPVVYQTRCIRACFDRTRDTILAWRAWRRNCRSFDAADVRGASLSLLPASRCLSSARCGSAVGNRRCRAAIGKPSTPHRSWPAPPAAAPGPTWRRCVPKGVRTQPCPVASAGHRPARCSRARCPNLALVQSRERFSERRARVRGRKRPRDLHEIGPRPLIEGHHMCRGHTPEMVRQVE